MSNECTINAGTSQSRQNWEEHNCKVETGPSTTQAVPGAPIARPVAPQFSAAGRPKAPKPQAAANSLLKHAPKSAKSGNSDKVADTAQDRSAAGLDAERYGSRILGLVREGFNAITRSDLNDAESLYEEGLHQLKEFREYHPNGKKWSQPWVYRLAALKARLLEEQAKEAEAKGQSAEDIKAMKVKAGRIYGKLRRKARTDSHAAIAYAPVAAQKGRRQAAMRYLAAAAEKSDDPQVKQDIKATIGSMILDETERLAGKAHVTPQDLSSKDQAFVSIGKDEAGGIVLQYTAAFYALPPDKQKAVIARVQQTAHEKLADNDSDETARHYHRGMQQFGEGHVEAALVSFQDFIRLSKDCTDKETKQMRADARRISRQLSIHILMTKGVPYIQALVAQRSNRLSIDKIDSTQQIEDERSLMILVDLLEKGHADSIEEAWNQWQKMSVSDKYRLREKYENGETVRVYTQLTLPEQEAGPGTSEKRVAEERTVTGALSTVSTRGDIGADMAKKSGIRTIHLEGGTIEIPAGRRAEAGYRIVIGRAGGMIKLANESRRFLPSGQERIVYVQRKGGNTVLITPPGSEGRSFSNWNTVNPVDSKSFSDQDLVNFVKLQSRSAIEERQTSEGQKKQWLAHAKSLRHRTGSYQVAAELLPKVFSSAYVEAQKRVHAKHGAHDGKLIYEEMDRMAEAGEMDLLALEAWQEFKDMIDPTDETWNIADETVDQLGDEAIMMAATAPVGFGAGTLAAKGITAGLSGFAGRSAAGQVAVKYFLVPVGRVEAASAGMTGATSLLTGETPTMDAYVDSFAMFGAFELGGFLMHGTIPVLARPLKLQPDTAGYNVVAKSATFSGQVGLDVGATRLMELGHGIDGTGNPWERIGRGVFNMGMFSVIGRGYHQGIKQVAKGQNAGDHATAEPFLLVHRKNSAFEEQPFPLVRQREEAVTVSEIHEKTVRRATDETATAPTASNMEMPHFDYEAARVDGAAAAAGDIPTIPSHIQHASSTQAAYIGRMQQSYMHGRQRASLADAKRLDLLDSAEVLEKTNQMASQMKDLETLNDVYNPRSPEVRAATRERLITEMSRYLDSDLKGLQAIYNRLTKQRAILLDNLKKHPADLELLERAKVLKNQIGEIGDAISVLNDVKAGNIPDNLNNWMFARLYQVKFSQYHQTVAARDRAANKAYATSESDLVLKLTDLAIKHKDLDYMREPASLAELAPYINEGEPHLSFKGLPEGVSPNVYRVRFTNKQTGELVEARVRDTEGLAQVLERNHWSEEDVTPVRVAASRSRVAPRSVPPRALEAEASRAREEVTAVEKIGGGRISATAEPVAMADIPAAVLRQRVVGKALASLDREHSQLFADHPEIRDQVRVALETDLTDGIFDAHKRFKRPDSELLETADKIAARVLAPYLTQ